MLNTLLEKVSELLQAVRLIQLEDVDIPGIRGIFNMIILSWCFFLISHKPS